MNFRKVIIFLLLVSIMPGCQNLSSTLPEKEDAEMTEYPEDTVQRESVEMTGYPEDTVQRELICVEGQLYEYDSWLELTEFEDLSAEFVGVVQVRNDKEVPKEDLHATHINEGSMVYRRKKNFNASFIVYVVEENEDRVRVMKKSNYQYGETDLQQETVTELQTSPLAPTGYPEGEVQRIFLFYLDKLWVPLDEDGSIREDIPGGYSEAATVQNEDNTKLPDKELSAAHLPVGTRIYTKAENPEYIYVDESLSDGSVKRYKKYVVYHIENGKFDY